ncbi:acyltransferase [Aliiroseovarius crassostreae]|uniref:acyltransferase family protein n=1 Tax=Aliiroseovarius crassostreae TaxID=154981 RepID=UPI00220FB1AE|nr:acyltransferase [Aliiroseovarius crassostreae]UWP91350.1 acyltransferase [Aliiroseovarius crassostreae]
MEFKPALAGLRGLAACLVLISHLALYDMLPHFPFLGLGAVGVMLFFVLSGYLMAAIYLPKHATFTTIWLFLTSRFARVYPLFALTIIVSAIGTTHFAIGPLFTLSYHSAFQHLTLIEGKWVFWTIVVEMKFYLLFLLFWLLTTRVRWNTRLLLVTGIYLACVFIPLLPRLSIFQNLQVFLVGMMLAFIEHRIPKSMSVFTTSAVVLLPAIAAFAMLSDGVDKYEIYRSPFAHLAMAFLVAAALVKNTKDAKVLSSKVFVSLGDWSFGIYLLHIPILRALHNLASFLEVHLIWMVFPAIAVTLGLSALVFRYFEAPVRKRIVAVLNSQLTRQGEPYEQGTSHAHNFRKR